VDHCDACQAAVAAGIRNAEALGRPKRNASAEAFVPGKIVAGYELERVLGLGGIGTVWSVKRVSDGCPFALKILRLASGDVVRRLHREARLASAFVHPNLVRVFDVIEVGESHTPALLMEQLVGEDLAVHLRRAAPLAVEVAARLFRPVAGVLLTLHERGVVHRDLKPSNVFLAAEGDAMVVKVLDLGMARALNLEQATLATHRLTQPGTVLGTPRYMAPEQLRGQDDINASADVWAFGCMFYEALAGNPPLASNRYPDILAELAAGPLPSIRTRIVTLRPDVADMVDRCLCLGRADRPYTIEIDNLLSQF